MASGPHNGTTTSFPPLPNFTQFKPDHMLPPQAINTSSNSMPRLGGPPVDSFFLRPPNTVVPTSTGSPQLLRDAPSLLSGLMPPLGLTSQFDPSTAAAAAAAVAAAGGKISPSVTSSYAPGDFPNAAAAAAAAVQASMKMASSRTSQNVLPSMVYEKMMANMLFSRPDMATGVAPPPPPPLGVRPPPGPILPPNMGAESPIFPPAPGCASSPFTACTSGKLPSPVLPHSASRGSAGVAANRPGDQQQGDRDDIDSMGEKKGKTELIDALNEESNPSSEYHGSNNDLTSPSVKSGNNNNICPTNKLVSKGIEFSYDDKSQTENEVQKLMSIALSNNQKRLEKACLNAIDKGSGGPAVQENSGLNDVNKMEIETDECKMPITDSQSKLDEPDQRELVKKDETGKSESPNDAAKIAQEEETEKSQENIKVIEAPPSENEDHEVSRTEEMERPAESGRASVDSEESMTSSNVEMLVANAQPDKEGLFFCHLCEFTGSTRTEFQDHMNWHYDFRCPKCDYTSRTEGRLNRHIRDFHSEVPPQNFSGKVTRVNKPKTHKCKQCNYIALTKTDFWAHSRTHIKDDKILECPKCDFVTEYKHHLEYHIRNHFGSKPYKCEKCNYECVNKSMLNSHMKSHTNVYQYRCADCQYATKYCHSLKLHLGKYQHRPATILNSDGSLPEYDNSSDILSIKRGPPRGSRLQRMNSEPNNLTPTSSPMDISSAPTPLSFLHAGASMGNFWSLPIPHQPGLFPGLPAMPPAFINQPSAVGPMCNPSASVIAPYLLPNSSLNMDDTPGARLHPKLDLSMNSSTDERKDGSLELHCNFCDHQADSRDTLVKHMLQNHKDENNDLFGASLLSGFAHDNMNLLRQDDTTVNGLDSFVGADALDLRSKKPSVDGENVLQNFFKRSIAQAIGVPVLPEDEDESSSAKRKCKESPSPVPGMMAADTPTGRKRPRKSKAFRINDLSQHAQSETNDSFASEKSSDLSMKKEDAAVRGAPEEDDEPSQDRDSRINESGDSSALNSLEVADHELDALVRTQECCHCNILFRDRTMFEMHMGYHGYGNPFKCNRCGHISQDKVQFFIHLCQMAHS